MLRKKAAVLTAVMMAAGAFAAPVYAAEYATVSVYDAASKEDADMKKALTLAKSRISIPSEYSHFSYSSLENNGMKQYDFSWTKSDKHHDGYSITVKGGLITNYNTPYLRGNNHSFAKYSADELEQMAIDWVCRINPAMKGCLRADGDTQIQLANDYVTVRLNRVYKDVKVDSNRASVTINKNTGEVAGFYCSWWQDAGFKDPSKALQQDDIKEIYRKEVSLKPWYRLNYDSKTEKYTAAIVYVPQNSFVYNAFTGKHSTMEEDYMRLLDTDLYFDDDEAVEEEAAVETDSGVAGEGGELVELSPEEIKGLEQMAELLTKEEFKKLLIKDPYIKVTNKFITKEYSINKNDHADCGFMISCTMLLNNKDDYCRYTISADAKSGRIYSFRRSGSDSEKQLNVSEANKLAEAAAEYYCSDIFGKYKADTENTAPAVKTDKYVTTNRSMKYYRYENNIQVQSNQINIGVNSDGIITSMNYSHTENVDFGDGKILSADKALDELFKQQDMTLEFDGFTDLKSKPYTYLHYTMKNWTVNAKTGKLCSYNGSPITEAQKFEAECPYTDISNSPYKDEIITLYNHGVRLYYGSKFNPGEKITTEEMSALLNAIKGYGVYPIDYDADTIYEEPEHRYITRTDMTIMLAERMNVDHCAVYRNIFRTPFKDVKESDENIGYIALAYGMGAIEPDSTGKFYPNAYMTREYAYHCIYTYVINNSKE